MLLGGLQKMTLIDYPGKIAATVFTVGCNFRCPFCHNPELVLSSQFTVSVDDNSLEKEFFEFLKTRQNKLDGVCITGGEPTLQSDLVKFISKIKKLGFAVKLDSNGTRPDILKEIFEKKLVDYVAMDIKSDLINYEKVCQVKVDLERIKTSVDLIKNSGVNYEFRTTVVPGLHREKDFEEIVQWLAGSRRYVLQRYQDYGKILDDRLRERTTGEVEPDLERIKQMFEGRVKEVLIR
jgi:pyruvate formate lyase activating enzyme